MIINQKHNTMEKTKKIRGMGPGNYERDILKKAMRDYKHALDKVRKECELAMSGFMSGNPNKPIYIKPPNFVKIVLQPILENVAERIPQFNMVLPGKDGIEPDRYNNFPITVGKKILGGIGFAGPTANHVNFTIYAFNRAWGKPLPVGSMKELNAILDMIIKVHDFSNQSEEDITDE